MLRTRRGTRVAVLCLVVGMLALPVSAVATEDDSSHSDKYEGVAPKQYEDFSAIAGNNANPDSNAPLSFSPCIRGMAAGEFPCDGIDLLSFVPHSVLGTSFVNDIWGWTDPETGRDYALVGASNGTVFVDITDPKRPNVQGILPTASTSGGSSWRDIKVYADHAFVVSEHSNHGMQVFDLTDLRDWDGSYTTYSEAARYTDKGRTHNLAINEDTGFAYLVGGSQDIHACNAGLHMVDISDPTNPTFVGCYGATGYVHDTQCVIYEGPDAEHQGREICFNSNAAGSYGSTNHWVEVVDVTDKSNPVSLSRENYPNSGYSHQAWLTPDQQYLLHGDEGDEQTHGIGTTTRIWDVRDLDAIELIGVFENDTDSIDHNIYTQGRYAYASNYTSGLRVYDTRNVANGELSEVAWFDVYPENDNATFEGGTWSNYPYFQQKGVVAVSSMDRGLFILQPRLGRDGN